MSLRKVRKSNSVLNGFNNKSILSPKKNTQLNKTFQLKKLKTLLSLNEAKIREIKRKQHFSSFHLVGEDDKYKLIEKNIQNKILNISMLIINDVKFDSDIVDVTSLPKIKKNSIKLLEGKPNNKKLEVKTNNKKFEVKTSNKNPNILSSLFRPSSNIPRLSRLSKNFNFANFRDLVYEKNRKIKRIHNLYDSFGEDESDRETQSGYGFNPRSVFIDVYDIFILLASVFCLFYMPFRLAKTKMIINNDEIFVLIMIYFSEIIFIFDLILGFFRWFYNNEFKLVSNRYMIISNYLYGYFLEDLIFAIPFYSIFKFKIGEKNEINNIYNEKYFVLKILICFKAFKIFKLTKEKNNRIVYFFNRKFAKNYYLDRVYQICIFIIIISSIFNLFISFHIYMGQLSYPNWIVSSNLQDKSFINIYLSSLYFIMATLTSVGYGDIVCINKEETCFQILLLSIGLVAYSWIISTVGDYVKNKSRATINYNRDMTRLEEIRIAYPNMPFKLYNKIQQHIQRLLTQNKKYENHLLINSLPYYLQNSVLFQIHKNEISKFTFFKNCDNSDFILKVLTHFIPISSKKNIVLVGEGEFLENIFFIKDGRLSLEAIIDLDNIEMSIEKYLKYRFEEIEQIEEISMDDNSFQNSKIIDQSMGQTKKIKPKNVMKIINKQFENIQEASYMHESNIEQELGKCDFHVECQDLYKGNIQYIHILDLLKNEHFGEILMFLNIPNPLSLRVKSKRVELYILRKKDAFNIKKDYQNIWQRLNKKSIHNIKSLKSLTLDIINRYCEMNGIIIKGGEIVKSKTKYYASSLSKVKTNNNNFHNLRTVTTKKNLKSKTMNIKQLDFDKNKNYNTYKTSKFGNLKEKEKKEKKDRDSLKQRLKTKFNISIENKNKNFKRKKSKSMDSVQKSIRSKSKKTLRYSESSSSLFSMDITEKNISKNYIKQRSPQQNLNRNKRKSKSQKFMINNKNEINKVQKKNIRKLGYLSPFSSVSAKSLQGRSPHNKNQKLDFKNNYMITGVSTINEFNSYESNYFKYVTRQPTISFEIKPSYKNINEMSKGLYIKDNKFQNLIQKIVNNYVLSNEKYSNKFSIFKNVTDINKKNKIKSDEIKQSKKKFTMDNPSIISGGKYSNPRKEKLFSFSDLKNNRFLYPNPKDAIFPTFKDKYILDPGENKSISSMNQLNSININKNNEISDIKNNFSYKNIQTFQDILNKNKKRFKEKKKSKNEKYNENVYSNNIINNKNGNSIHEVNLNYVNNFCNIY